MRAKELATSSVSGPVTCSWVQGPSTGVTVQPLTAVEIAAGNYADLQGAVDVAWVQAPTSAGTLVIGERRVEASETSIEETRVVTVTDPAVSSVVVDALDSGIGPGQQKLWIVLCLGRLLPFHWLSRRFGNYGHGQRFDRNHCWLHRDGDRVECCWRVFSPVGVGDLCYPTGRG